MSARRFLSRLRGMPADDATFEEFDLWWAGGKPDTGCQSCHGTGWATVRAGNITVAGGRCVCRGGNIDATPKVPVSSGSDPA